MFFGWEGPEGGSGGGGHLFEFEYEGEEGGWGCSLIRGWEFLRL